MDVEAIDRNGAGRSTLWDITLFPRVRYPLAVGNGLLEVQAGPTLGVSHNVLADEVKLERGTDHSATGFTVGARAGVAYFFSDRVGVSAELGYQHNAFTFAASDDDDLKLSFGQLRLSAGVLVTL